jgi:hypothetical protein
MMVFTRRRRHTMSTNQKIQSKTSEFDFDDDLSDENNPKMVTIQIRLGAATARHIKFAREGFVAIAALTLVSAVWGAGMAWWIAWSEFSGAASEKQLAQAKVVAAEVTKSIAMHGALAQTERSLLTEIRDHFDNLLARTTVKMSREQVATVAPAAEVLERARETGTARKARATTSPDLNFNVRNASASLPMRIEGLSFYHTADRDILRVEVGNVSSRVTTGEVTAALKFLVDGKEVVVGCCGSEPVSANGVLKATSGVMFRTRYHVTKHIEFTRPKGESVKLIAAQVGFLTPSHPTFVFSSWISSERETIPVVAVETPAPQVNQDMEYPKAAHRVTPQLVEPDERPRVSLKRQQIEADLSGLDPVTKETVPAENVGSASDDIVESPMQQAMRVLSSLRPKTAADTADDVMVPEEILE